MLIFISVYYSVCKNVGLAYYYGKDQVIERKGQTPLSQSLLPMNQHHQRRMLPHQTSIDTSTRTPAIQLTPGAAPVIMRRTKSQEDSLDDVTVETFKPKCKLIEKRSISWSSAWETSTITASRSVDRELSQIYDVVNPVTKVNDERDLGFSQLSYPGCPTKELLPSCDASSMLYASLYAVSDHGSAYDVPKKAALTYSVPEVKKKREKKEESSCKEQSYEAIINPEEIVMLNDFKGHYDTPKSKHTPDKEITSSCGNVSYLYDQPRIIKPNLGN